jgi:dTDP-4-dehydrorhamnose 3,5-epimerase
MHFQYTPHAEMKLITCLRGAIWDVAVDLRVGSATFLQWYAAELTATNNRAILIPEGFAHGFQTLSDSCELLYLHSSAYKPEAESGLSPLDPLLSINWPLPISDLSEKDAQQLPVGPEFIGVLV